MSRDSELIIANVIVDASEAKHTARWTSQGRWELTVTPVAPTPIHKANTNTSSTVYFIKSNVTLKICADVNTNNHNLVQFILYNSMMERVGHFVSHLLYERPAPGNMLQIKDFAMTFRFKAHLSSPVSDSSEHSTNTHTKQIISHKSPSLIHLQEPARRQRRKYTFSKGITAHFVHTDFICSHYEQHPGHISKTKTEYKRISEDASFTKVYKYILPVSRVNIQTEQMHYVSLLLQNILIIKVLLYESDTRYKITVLN